MDWYGKPSYEFPGKSFKITQKIPKGKVATYSQLAKLTGIPKGARAVGLFMRTNPKAPIVPCHRVVSFDGKLTGYSANGGLKTKKNMLIKEGVKFLGQKVWLEKSLWKPQFSGREAV